MTLEWNTIIVKHLNHKNNTKFRDNLIHLIPYHHFHTQIHSLQHLPIHSYFHFYQTESKETQFSLITAEKVYLGSARADARNKKGGGGQSMKLPPVTLGKLSHT